MRTYDATITYDENSNITGVVDNVLINDAKNRSFDVKYDLDGLNRVTKVDERAFSGTPPSLSSSDYRIGHPARC